MRLILLVFIGYEVAALPSRGANEGSLMEDEKQYTKALRYFRDLVSDQSRDTPGGEMETFGDGMCNTDDIPIDEWADSADDGRGNESEEQCKQVCLEDRRCRFASYVEGGWFGSAECRRIFRIKNFYCDLITPALGKAKTFMRLAKVVATYKGHCMGYDHGLWLKPRYQLKRKSKSLCLKICRALSTYNLYAGCDYVYYKKPLLHEGGYHEEMQCNVYIEEIQYGDGQSLNTCWKLEGAGSKKN